MLQFFNPSEITSQLANDLRIGGQKMPNQIVTPPIDLAALPRELEGKWVLVCVEESSQRIVSSGDDPREATRGQDTNDPRLLLTQVPRECSLLVVQHES